MYSLDIVVSMTGLSERQIHQLEKDGIVSPQKLSGMKYYSFTDIYIFKLTSIMKREGIPFRNIRQAYDCLRNLKPGRKLSAFSLYHDGKQVLDFTDNVAIIASKYGQTVDGKFMLSVGHIEQLSLGTELDRTREKILDISAGLKRRRTEVKKLGKVYSRDEIRGLLQG
ncbi:MAG TPA: MerR family transcriptional regulator [Coleofasciculaceae cyanobacterium]|jgi:DNA-binding transcriptional MerR regulator